MQNGGCLSRGEALLCDAPMTAVISVWRADRIAGSSSGRTSSGRYFDGPRCGRSRWFGEVGMSLDVDVLCCGLDGE